MHACDFHAVTFDADIYCNGCLPHAVDINSAEVSPIFGNSEWDYVPVCCQCGHAYDYVSLTSPTIHTTKITTWFERDRAHVALVDIRTDQTIVEWWDEAVGEAVEDGFLSPRNWHKSALDFAKSARLI